MNDLPDSVLDLVEMNPIEDVLLPILRDGLHEVPVFTLIPDDPPPFFILVRRLPGMGGWGGDPRFIDEGRFYIHVLTSDPDGDEKGALLSEAVRVVLRNASLARTVVPNRGSILLIEMLQEPSRRTDWATAAGPVQFADLPVGYWRYESQFRIAVRKPR